jgi:hypothetical protein
MESVAAAVLLLRQHTSAYVSIRQHTSAYAAAALVLLLQRWLG